MISVQPFRKTAHYSSTTIPDLKIQYAEPAIVMSSNRQWEAMSNAVYHGGLATISTAINYRVSLDYESDAPWDDFMNSLQQIDPHSYKTHQEKTKPEQCAGFMTAAKLTHAAISEVSQRDFAIMVLATAGTSNAVRAGSSRPTYPGYHAGTINLFVWVDARMSQAAIVNAIMTATEAKSAALADLAVVEKFNGLIATGTSTDAILIAVSQSTDFPNEHQYAGAATELGCRLGELVYSAVHTAVLTQQEH